MTEPEITVPVEVDIPPEIECLVREDVDDCEALKQQLHDYLKLEICFKFD